MLRMHTHTHTHMRACMRTPPQTVQTDMGGGQCCLAEIFWAEECLEFAFEGREISSAWCLGGDCSRCRSQSVRKCQSHGFAVEALEFEHACLTKSGDSRKGCYGVVAQKDKTGQNLWLHCNTCKQFCILFIQKLGASGVAVGEVCSFDGMVLWE